VQLGNQSAITTGTGGGPIQVTAGGELILGQTVTTAGGGAIELTTRSWNFRLDQSVTYGGDLSLAAVAQLSITAALNGDQVDLTGDTGIVHTATGGVTATDTLIARATAGDIGMADGTLYTAGRAVSLQARNVELGHIQAGANPIAVAATADAITDNTTAEDSGNENLVSGVIALTAVSSIGEAGTDADLDVFASRIEYTAGGEGGTITENRIDVTTQSGGIYINVQLPDPGDSNLPDDRDEAVDDLKPADPPSVGRPRGFKRSPIPHFGQREPTLFYNLTLIELYAIPDYSLEDPVDLWYLSGANEDLWGKYEVLRKEAG